MLTVGGFRINKTQSLIQFKSTANSDLNLSCVYPQNLELTNQLVRCSQKSICRNNSGASNVKDLEILGKETSECSVVSVICTNSCTQLVLESNLSCKWK